MDRKQVERFLAVVEHGSMTAAAKALFLNQASVSTSIRELETEAGAQLFDRNQNPLELTGAGRALLPAAIGIVRSFRDAESRLEQAVTAGPAGQFFIGCSAAVATEPAIDLMARFCRDYPTVELRCEEAPADQEAFELLKSGRYELLLHSETPHRDLFRTPLASEGFWAAFPPGSDVGEGPMSVADVAEFGLIASQTVDASSLSRAAGDLATERAEVRFPAVCQDRRIIAGLVVRGAGATIVPESMAAELGGQGAVVRPMNWPERPSWIYHRDGQLSASAAAFLALAEHAHSTR